MRKIVTRCFIGVMVLFMASIFLRFFTKNVLIEKLQMDNIFTKIIFFDSPTSEETAAKETTTEEVDIDWEKLYPFRDSDAVGFNNIAAGETSILDDFKNTVFRIEEKVERYTHHKDNLVMYMQIVESAVKYENLIGLDLLNVDAFYLGGENAIDLGNGWLTQLNKRLPPPPPGHTPATALYELNDFLAGLDIDFLYIQCPHKISKKDKIIGMSDFTNENADELLEALSLRHIPYLDLRATILQENLDHHSLFYKTDHHWKAETGLWAAGIIAEYLNRNNGFDIDLDLFDPEHYRYDTYENWFLGYYGRIVTLKRARPEDINLIYPLFDTNFSLRIPSRKIDKEGGFDIMYDYSQIDKIDYYNLSPYAAYLYSNNPVTLIHNNLLNDGRKILVIHDSFFPTVGPFLAVGIENLETIDVRVFTGSVKTYIRQTQPDMVIVMQEPGQIRVPDYTVHTGTFDFR